MAPRKTLPKKTKIVSSVSEEGVSSMSDKGGRSPAPSCLWEVSTVMEEDIKGHIVGGFLAPKELSGYQCALGQDVSAPDTSGIVVFVDFFHHGFNILYTSLFRISFIIMVHKCTT